MSDPHGRVEAMSPDKLLTFEHSWPQHSGHKETAIRRELGITPARYYVLLHRAARSIEGMAADPITARRVRALASSLS